MTVSRLLIGLAMTLISSGSHAFFCPKNFNNINFGDSLTDVQAACGPADKIVLKDAPDTSPQEWNYYLRQPSTVTTGNQSPGTLKTSFAFDASGNLVNISIGGISTSATSNCRSKVSLGDSRESVEEACGKSTMINKQTSYDAGTTASSGKENDESNKQAELTYHSTPPVTLIFVRGKLTDKK